MTGTSWGDGHHSGASSTPAGGAEGTVRRPLPEDSGQETVRIWSQVGSDKEGTKPRDGFGTWQVAGEARGKLFEQLLRLVPKNTNSSVTIILDLFIKAVPTLWRSFKINC